MVSFFKIKVIKKNLIEASLNIVNLLLSMKRIAGLLMHFQLYHPYDLPLAHEPLPQKSWNLQYFWKSQHSPSSLHTVWSMSRSKEIIKEIMHSAQDDLYTWPLSYTRIPSPGVNTILGVFLAHYNTIFGTFVYCPGAKKRI